MFSPKNAQLHKTIQQWNTDQLILTLEANGLYECCDTIKHRQIDGDAFLKLTESQLSLWKNTLNFVQIKRLWSCVQLAQERPHDFVINNEPAKPTTIKIPQKSPEVGTAKKEKIKSPIAASLENILSQPIQGPKQPYSSENGTNIDPVPEVPQRKPPKPTNITRTPTNITATPSSIKITKKPSLRLTPERTVLPTPPTTFIEDMLLTPDDNSPEFFPYKSPLDEKNEEKVSPMQERSHLYPKPGGKPYIPSNYTNIQISSPAATNPSESLRPTAPSLNYTSVVVNSGNTTSTPVKTLPIPPLIPDILPDQHDLEQENRPKQVQKAAGSENPYPRSVPKTHGRISPSNDPHPRNVPRTAGRKSPSNDPFPRHGPRSGEGINSANDPYPRSVPRLGEGNVKVPVPIPPSSLNRPLPPLPDDQEPLKLPPHVRPIQRPPKPDSLRNENRSPSRSPRPPLPEEEDEDMDHYDSIDNVTSSDYRMQSWYRDVDRIEAQNLLRGRPNGTFIVRPSKKLNSECGITVICNRRFFNLAVTKDEDNFILGRKTFTSVVEIIQTYTETNMMLSGPNNEDILVTLKEL